MQLKEEFRSYEALRREHDAQIVHIAMEAGLRISPEQWSSLLYGDLAHKSHMQSIIDKVREIRDPNLCCCYIGEYWNLLQRLKRQSVEDSMFLKISLIKSFFSLLNIIFLTFKINEWEAIGKQIQDKSRLA